MWFKTLGNLIRTALSSSACYVIQLIVPSLDKDYCSITFIQMSWPEGKEGYKNVITWMRSPWFSVQQWHPVPEVSPWYPVQQWHPVPEVEEVVTAEDFSVRAMTGFGSKCGVAHPVVVHKGLTVALFVAHISYHFLSHEYNTHTWWCWRKKAKCFLCSATCCS